MPMLMMLLSQPRQPDRDRQSGCRGRAQALQLAARSVAAGDPVCGAGQSDQPEYRSPDQGRATSVPVPRSVRRLCGSGRAGSRSGVAALCATALFRLDALRPDTAVTGRPPAKGRKRMLPALSWRE